MAGSGAEAGAGPVPETQAHALGATPADAEALRQLAADPAYQQAVSFLDAHDWQPAEGLLRWLRHCHGDALSFQIDSLLGYCLSMQADHAEAWQRLAPLLQHPQRTFWLAHLAADAQRGLGDWAAAATLYRTALTEGSDSPITVRNLLQVLLLHDAGEALQQLEQWRQQGALAGFVLEGIREALAANPDPALDAWLDRLDLAGPDQHRRLLEQELRRLDLAAITRRLQHPSWQASPWRAALAQRLHHWGLTNTRAG